MFLPLGWISEENFSNRPKNAAGDRLLRLSEEVRRRSIQWAEVGYWPIPIEYKWGFPSMEVPQ